MSARANHDGHQWKSNAPKEQPDAVANKKNFEGVKEVKNCTLKPYIYIFVEHLLYIDLCNYGSSLHLQEDFPSNSA